MARWGWLLGVVGLALLVVGARGHPTGPVGAQAGTPTAGDAAAAPDHSAEATRLYDDFIAKLAANLNVADPTVVDTAVRTSLKQMVDEHQAAGGLSAEHAAAIKERIDAENFPLSLHPSPGPGRHHGRWDDDHDRWGDDHDRDDDRDHKGGWDDSHDRDDDDDWADRRDHDDDEDDEQPRPDAAATPTS